NQDGESVDVWLDSSCNGYEDDPQVGAQGLRYGRREDGTVIGSGDDPCVLHENRLYARIHNQGTGPAHNVRVHIFVIDESAKIVFGNRQWIPAGIATLDQFPSLASLAPGASTEVYVPWTFSGENSGFALPPDYIYPTAIRVYIEPVSNEPQDSQYNQAAEEVVGNVDLRTSPDPTAGWEFYDPFFWIKNPFLDHINPLPFYLDVQSEMAGVTLSSEFANPVLLNPGETVAMKLNIATTPVGAAASNVTSAISSPTVGVAYPVRLTARTLVTTKNDAVLDGSIYQFRRDSAAIGTVAITLHTVYKTDVSVEANWNPQGHIDVSGKIEPSPGRVFASLDYIDPENQMQTRLIQTEEDGTFTDTMPAAKAGQWSVRPIWQGNREYAYDLGELVTVEVAGSPPETTAILKPMYPDGKNGWYVSPVMITLSVSDPDMDVVATNYRINNGEWQKYTSPFVVTNESSDNIVEFYSQDAAGNIEPVKNVHFKIDKTAPTMSCSAQPSIITHPDGRLVAVRTSVKLNDVLSGANGFVLKAITSSDPGASYDIRGFVIGTPDLN
ncbi:MAG: hypothetical protein R3240_12700, partial [Gammaproteobacteria bacterium]|nr:hypothetical protein [Gammaproteobacteria bacterium]